MFLPVPLLGSAFGSRGTSSFLALEHLCGSCGWEALLCTAAQLCRPEAERHACSYSCCIIPAGHGPKPSFLKGLQSLKFLDMQI